MIEIIVNGARCAVKSAADTPLLWVLRDELGLTGTRFGCGAGLCGCCTVHVDGAAMRSCSIAIGDVTNRNITTIEHLSKDGLHPLQQAWIKLDVPQCGYCQSGQLMQAAALLGEKPKPWLFRPIWNKETKIVQSPATSYRGWMEARNVLSFRPFSVSPSADDAYE
jgi:isoquinoline 1-oxidoreductase alpha subunit